MSKISIEKVIELFDAAVSKSTKKIDLPEWFEKFQELFKSSVNKKKKAEKDSKAPKKPLTSYIIFCTDKRKTVVDKNPTMAPKDVSRKLAELWKALSDSEKMVYVKKAEAEKERYAHEMENYSHSSDDHSSDDHNDHDHSEHSDEEEDEEEEPPKKEEKKKAPSSSKSKKTEEPKKVEEEPKKSEKVEKAKKTKKSEK